MLLFGSVVISELYLFQETALFNPCFQYSKNFLLLLKDKVTTGILSLVLFIWNIVPFVNPSGTCSIGRLVTGLAGASVVYKI